MKNSANVCLVLLLTCLVPVRAEDESKTDWSCLAGYAVAGIAGGTLAVAATPIVLGAAGFTGAGVAAGSLAAGVQSAVYGGAVASGSVFAGLQGVGAAGLGVAAKTAVFSTGAATAAYVKDKLAPCAERPKCSKD
ncbi:interferon alpha-inducible protein 27-like protein 2 isoform X2 [Exaiptasia diaphana]|uniref:Uncharacterized protein n=1 Tax=Exaiptasia diaphana TaxID=2652724 RepID=A0A913Y596_EXADI|nr:interferon alpha-inducible protein 27-like protein 2 isoform X2 [Exaiptasia diaphana]